MSLSFLLFRLDLTNRFGRNVCARVCVHAYVRTCVHARALAHTYARMRVPVHAHAHVLAFGQGFKQLLFFSSGLDSTNLWQKRLRWIYDRKMNSEKDFEKTCLYTHTHTHTHTHARACTYAHAYTYGIFIFQKKVLKIFFSNFFFKFFF